MLYVAVGVACFIVGWFANKILSIRFYEKLIDDMFFTMMNDIEEQLASQGVDVRYKEGK